MNPNRKVALVVVPALLALLGLVPSSSAVCCRNIPQPKSPSPYSVPIDVCGNCDRYWSSCCGNGGCNIFCCNCADDCIKGKCSQDLEQAGRGIRKGQAGRSFTNSTSVIVHNLIKDMDKDGDGAVNEAEFKAYQVELPHKPARGAESRRGGRAHGGMRGRSLGDREDNTFKALDKNGDGKLEANEIDSEVA
jgi:Diedel/EF hand